MQIKIKVKPNSKKQEITKISETEYQISLKSPPENNKANIELIKIMKKHLKKEVKIKSGLKSKNKILEVKC
ncbi:MAG: DUF167 domain-containing protein [Nanoarchaeota archaeon]|nr:DUF167 domain-containing protein [Nanoarchaeota archaeon]